MKLVQSSIWYLKTFFTDLELEFPLAFRQSWQGYIIIIICPPCSTTHYRQTHWITKKRGIDKHIRTTNVRTRRNCGDKCRLVVVFVNYNKTEFCHLNNRTCFEFLIADLQNIIINA